MHRRLLTLLAALVVFASITIAPAAAGTNRAVRGDLDIGLNLGIVLQQGAAPHVSWYGDIDFRGATYPIVYYGGLLEEHGDWVYFEDSWEILDSLYYEVEGGVITVFEPGNVIIGAEEKGWGAPSGWAYGLGRIVTANPEADPHGVLDGVSLRDITLWTGSETDDAGLEFAGRFRIFTGR
ncbi:MAG: hypothetical protein QNJ81_12085 [Acidimicrobiia bacterium]|nr:hypothetical protein [Acidimicrobiia bacterium]